MSRFAAAVRYVWAVLFSTQRWVAPAVILIGLIAWVWSTPPLGIDTVRVSLLVLFALAAWLGHATGTVEESGQELVSTSALGSARGLLVAKWTVSAGVSAVFPLLLVLGSYVWSRQRAASGSQPLLGADQAWTSVLAVVVVAASGAAVGLLVASLLPGRPGWSTTVLVLAALSQAAPGWPVVALVAAALPEPAAVPGPDLAVALMLGIAAAAAALAAAAAVRRPAG